MKIQTDICVVGAGPIGLFAVFQAGLLKMRCHVVDVLPQGDSQLSTGFVRKDNCNILENSNISAHELIGILMEQIYPFYPGFTRGESIEKLSYHKNESFNLLTNKGTHITCRAVVYVGHSPTLASIANCTEDIDHSIMEVNTQDYQTIIPGIFVIGDYRSYSDKMASFTPGFIKASLVAQAAFKYIHPLKHLCLKSNKLHFQ